MANHIGHERAGTAYDPNAVGHELQGRDAAPTKRCPTCKARMVSKTMCEHGHERKDAKDSR